MFRGVSKMESQTSFGKVLSTTDVEKITGWSKVKIRTLIHQKKLDAINTSTGERPLWGIPEESLRDFLTPRSKVAQPEQIASTRKQRIDANVPKVFG
jgi:hypothetical protein